MALTIKELLAKKGTACRSGEIRHSFYGVTIHETANTSKGAGAINHANYLLGSGSYKAASWHYCVDDELATRSIPENECAWHSGNSKGNYNTIAIEICVNSDGNFQKAVLNAAELAADILKRHGVSYENYKDYLFQHNYWSGKNCPAKLRKGEGLTWAYFVERVGKHLQPITSANKGFIVGESVLLNGYLYTDSYASKKGKYYSNKKCKITKIVDKTRPAPYLVDNGLGWVKESELKKG